MDPELDRLDREFSEQVGSWISKQGLFFQLTHSYGRGYGSIIPKLFALLIRLLILLLIVIVIFWFYLTHRVNTESYKLDVEQQIKAGVNASDIEIMSAERFQGGLLEAKLKISNLTLTGSDDSFYEDWYSEEERDLDDNVITESKGYNLSVESAIIEPLGIGDGVLNGWSGKKIILNGLSCHLKTGGDSKQNAMASYSSLFKSYKSLKVDDVSITNSNISWGYDVSKGSIVGAEIEAQRMNDVWNITVTGGTFSQGWLQAATIKEMKIECHENGLVKIVSADLNFGNGNISFDAEIQIESKPVVKGKFSFEGVRTIDLVGTKYVEWLDGQIKGEGVIDGTLNSRSGVNYKTTVKLDAPSTPSIKSGGAMSKRRKVNISDSFLILRDSFPILRSMQRIDPVNSYNLLRLNIGEFTIEQNGLDTFIKDIKIKSDDFLMIEGSLKYVMTQLNESKEQEVDPDKVLENVIEDKLIETNQEFKLDTIVKSNKRVVKILDGELKLGFIPQVFDNNSEIIKLYTVDTDTNRVWIPVEMKGLLSKASSSTAKKLEEIVKAARDKKNNN